MLVFELSGDLLHSVLRTMRYSAEHKSEVRQRIVQDAALRVRAEGLTGAAVTAVMRDAGLTHGGFYKHFASKDELLAESVQEAFKSFIDKLVQVAEKSRSGEAWKSIVTCFLSLDHCDDPGHGCPVTALAPELARADRTMRAQVVTDIVSYKDRMTPFMPGRQTSDKERAFLAIFSTMIGALQIARTLPDRAVKEKVLASVKDFLLASF
jgi:TetR/AcrR family transcriptional regulator, transcriptional repressor for nem operon